jgi:hypothetical protein
LLRAKHKNAEAQQKFLQKAKRTPRSNKKLVHLSLSPATKSSQKGENLFKLTLGQTPGSAKKKKQQLKMMRDDALNTAARCDMWVYPSDSRVVT